MILPTVFASRFLAVTYDISSKALTDSGPDLADLSRYAMQTDDTACDGRGCAIASDGFTLLGANGSTSYSSGNPCTKWSLNWTTLDENKDSVESIMEIIQTGPSVFHLHFDLRRQKSAITDQAQLCSDVFNVVYSPTVIDEELLSGQAANMAFQFVSELDSVVFPCQQRPVDVDMTNYAASIVGLVSAAIFAIVELIKLSQKSIEKREVEQIKSEITRLQSVSSSNVWSNDQNQKSESTLTQKPTSVTLT